MSRAQRVMAAILMCAAGAFLPLQVSAQFRKGLGQGMFEVTD
ncbi:MAG TPA: hypothetical protein VM115_09500 [Vicinamibacterales bacterium]|nr:hypothetical protein [Vicinamibacterales bacterium]